MSSPVHTCHQVDFCNYTILKSQYRRSIQMDRARIIVFGCLVGANGLVGLIGVLGCQEVNIHSLFGYTQRANGGQNTFRRLCYSANEDKSFLFQGPEHSRPDGGIVNHSK